VNGESDATHRMVFFCGIKHSDGDRIRLIGNLRVASARQTGRIAWYAWRHVSRRKRSVIIFCLNVYSIVSCKRALLDAIYRRPCDASEALERANTFACSEVK